MHSNRNCRKRSPSWNGRRHARDRISRARQGPAQSSAGRRFCDSCDRTRISRHRAVCAYSRHRFRRHNESFKRRYRTIYSARTCHAGTRRAGPQSHPHFCSLQLNRRTFYRRRSVGGGGADSLGIGRGQQHRRSQSNVLFLRSIGSGCCGHLSIFASCSTAGSCVSSGCPGALERDRLQACRTIQPRRIRRRFCGAAPRRHLDETAFRRVVLVLLLV